jgi:photosystem II stability/assembly factor-like uncharacterized protein
MSVVTPVRRLSSLLVFLLVSRTLFAGENVWTTNGPPGSITALEVHSGIVFAGSLLIDRTVGFRSATEDTTWIEVGELPVLWSISDFLFDPLDPARIYAAASSYTAFESRIYRSEDQGLVWREVASFGGLVLDLAAPAGPPGVLYAATSSCRKASCTAEVQKSFDFGVTWVSRRDGLAGPFITTIAVDPLDPNRVYAGGNAGVFVSSDAGEHWSAVNSEPTCFSVLALAIRPSDGAVFAGAGSVSGFGLNRFSCGGVYRSTDAGKSWSAIALAGAYVTSVAIDAADPRTVYAGASLVSLSGLGGVFRSDDGGETWAPFRAGLPSGGVTHLVIDSSGRTLHAAATGGHVFDIEVVPGERPPILLPKDRQTRTLPARP